MQESRFVKGDHAVFQPDLGKHDLEAGTCRDGLPCEVRGFNITTDGIFYNIDLLDFSSGAAVPRVSLNHIHASMVSQPSVDTKRLELIARVAYAVNRAYVGFVHAEEMPTWAAASAAVRTGYLLGANAKLVGNITPQEQHEMWVKSKYEAGWTYGPVKDDLAMTHPAMVEYDDLPPEQKVKDFLFQSVVTTFKEQQ